MTIDRITPGAKGGRYVDGNIQLLCQSCNSMKSDGTMAQLAERLERAQACEADRVLAAEDRR